MSIEQNTIKENKNFFVRIWLRIKNSEYTYLAAAFFLPFAIMAGAFACMEFHPFGNSSILTLDFQAQYIFYYEKIRDLLVNGGSWLYSWQRTLGGEFMGIVAYYMGSPFNLLLVLFPKKNIVDAVTFIQLCKIGAMGLNFGIYLHKTRKLGQMKTIALSMMYALCGYAVIQTIDPMWLDAVVFLPLLILGTEYLVRKRKVILYIISLSVIFISNYYMGYMCGIFTFLYFCYYYYVVRPEIYKGEDRFFRSVGFKTFMRFAFSTLLAIGLSSFMLYAAWYSLGFGKMGWLNVDFSFRLRFDYLDLFINMLPGSYTSLNRGGQPEIYCGMVALMCMPLFYLSKSVPKRQKIAATGMLFALTASFTINTIDLVWHGFAEPNWLNYRYAYVFSFFALTLAADALKGVKKVKPSYIVATGITYFILVLIIQKLKVTFQQGDNTIALNSMRCIMFSLIVIVIYTAVLRMMQNRKKAENAAFLLAAVVCVEMFVASLLNAVSVQEEVGVTRYGNYLDSNGNEVYSSYTGSIDRIKNVVDKILDSDKTFYRMESTVYRCNVNEPMAFGYNGISHSTSTLNENVIRMMARMGYASDSHWTKYLGGTPVSDALLGIKYVITKNDTLDRNIFNIAAQGEEGYQIVKSDNIIYAMQNTKALSVAYGVSENIIEDMKELTYPPYISGLDYQNRLIKSMLSETGVKGDVLKGITASVGATDCSRSTFNQTHKYNVGDEEKEAINPYYCFEKNGDSPKALFDFTAPVDGPIYFHFTSANFGKTFDVYLKKNDNSAAYISDCFGTDTKRIMKLGDFKKGDRVTVELRLKDDALYLSKESKYFFYYIDYTALNEAFDQLSAAEMYIEKYGNDFLKGTIDLPTGQELIFTSIPYDAGWNVYIDGKKAETLMVCDSLLAVKSTAGYHDIEFRYMPKGYVLAMIITAISIVVFICFIIFVKVDKVRRSVYRLAGKKYAPYGVGGDMIYVTENVPDEEDVPATAGMIKEPEPEKPEPVAPAEEEKPSDEEPSAEEENK